MLCRCRSEDMVDEMCVKYRSSCVQGGGEDIGAGLSRSQKSLSHAFPTFQPQWLLVAE
jgi:phage tail protein X